MKRKLKEIMDNISKDKLLKCIESLGYLSVTENSENNYLKQDKPDEPDKSLEEKRKNVDYQWSEYIVYLVCKNGEKITIFEDFEKTFDPLIEKGYLTDLLKADKKRVMKYYNTFYDLFQQLHLNVKNVFLLGKNQSKFSEIKKIHALNEKFKGKFKADVIVNVENNNPDLKNANNYIGLSVKSSEQDTLTNYSIYKMLSKDDVNVLKEIQKFIITSNGLSLSKEVYRKNREKYNKLFSNGSSIENEYHITLNEIILENKEDILRHWYKNLFGSLPYELYTFNGTTLTNDAPLPEFINIKSIQNPAKKDNTNAAKLFYAVYDTEDKGTPIYKWEIRWKGDIFVSPQILTFKWNHEKDHLKVIKAKE